MGIKYSNGACWFTKQRSQTSLEMEQKDGKLVRYGKGGSNWWRYQHNISVPKYIPFAQLDQTHIQVWITCIPIQISTVLN